jgi:hypothetical protein
MRKTFGASILDGTAQKIIQYLAGIVPILATINLNKFQSSQAGERKSCTRKALTGKWKLDTDLSGKN